MKITQENMEHVQEILDKYKVGGLNDLDQRLFEWGEENMKLWDVEVTRPVTFRIRVAALDDRNACEVANDIIDGDPNGPNVEHGSYRIHDHAFFDTERIVTRATEVKDAEG